MLTINMHDAKTQLSKLVEAAEAGEEVIIARNGKPAVKLVPIGLEKQAVKRIGAARTIFGDSLDGLTLEKFNESDAEIEATFDDASWPSEKGN